jgi:transcriptional/translational regulatory protein YebC/TACO1
VGGTSGALAGLFAKAGYDEHEARYYGEAVERGGIFVAVDTSASAATADEVRSIMTQYGGHMAGGSSTAMAA